MITYYTNVPIGIVEADVPVGHQRGHRNKETAMI